MQRGFWIALMAARGILFSTWGFFIPEKQVAISGMFNLENIPGPDRIVLVEALADVILGEAKPNPDHFTPAK